MKTHELKTKNEYQTENEDEEGVLTRTGPVVTDGMEGVVDPS